MNNWMDGIQRSIDYIEDNLTSSLDYVSIATKAYYSSFHFQRVFGIICGISVGEYIRKRRLTKAAEELLNNNIKVIDVAIKYGYDSSESFSRAFYKFHNILPSQVKKKRCINSFSKISIKSIIQGGSIMNYKIIQKKAFKVIEKVRTFSIVNDQNLKDIPKFWDEVSKDGTIETLCSFIDSGTLKDSILGICYGNSIDTNFDYSIAASYNGKEPVPQEFNIREIPAETWAVFSCKGKLPNAIQDMWHKIYTEFFSTSEYISKDEIDFEVYPSGNNQSAEYEAEIWIAVIKK